MRYRLAALIAVVAIILVSCSGGGDASSEPRATDTALGREPINPSSNDMPGDTQTPEVQAAIAYLKAYQAENRRWPSGWQQAYVLEEAFVNPYGSEPAWIARVVLANGQTRLLHSQLEAASSGSLDLLVDAGDHIAFLDYWQGTVMANRNGEPGVVMVARNVKAQLVPSPPG